MFLLPHTLAKKATCNPFYHINSSAKYCLRHQVMIHLRLSFTAGAEKHAGQVQTFPSRHPPIGLINTKTRSYE